MNISKLPKWAQEHIENLKRERDEALRVMNKTIDEQTPSAIYTDDAPCVGEAKGPSFKRRYFQARHIRIDHAGIEVDVFLAEDNDSQRPHGVCISFCETGRHLGYVAVIPTSFNQIALVNKDNMDR